MVWTAVFVAIALLGAGVTFWGLRRVWLSARALAGQVGDSLGQLTDRAAFLAEAGQASVWTRPSPRQLRPRPLRRSA
ncbi:MAG: hypothetical protein LBJ44_06600 [Propionibacteriaceae bacterium]|nr:hypothetical protein [Propionibacteriaceae bacterium]